MSEFPWNLLDRVPVWFWWLLGFWALVFVVCEVADRWIDADLRVYRRKHGPDSRVQP